MIRYQSLSNISIVVLNCQKLVVVFVFLLVRSCLLITVISNQVDEVIQEALFKADKEDAQMTALRGFVDLQVISIITIKQIMVVITMVNIYISTDNDESDDYEDDR